MRYVSLSLFLVLCGCAGGPTHDYYNPAIADAPKRKGSATSELVEDVKSEKERLIREGYKVIGTTDYVGKYPEAVELQAQAKRVNASHVIYSCKYIPPTPGSWSFSFGRGFGSGGTGQGANEVHIIFLGKL